MNQAFEIAEKHAVASGMQNKKYYGKKVQGVEIGVGDRVLSRNRAKGGTGKLRCYWENMVYTVIGKEEHVPVYTIKPEKGKGRTKRVHRNDIMRCTDLLLNDGGTTSTKCNRKTQPTKSDINKPEPVIAAAPEAVVSDDESETEQLVGIHVFGVSSSILKWGRLWTQMY